MTVSGPTDRTAIVQQLATDLSRAAWMTQVHDVRCRALINGVWDELSVKFPKAFREAFALVGSSTASPLAFDQVPAATPVSPERLQALAGKAAFLRIRRADGRTEAVAGTLGSISTREIGLPAFDVERAERLMQPGDALLFREASNRYTNYGVPLETGDMVVTAIALPVEAMHPTTTAQKRISLSERAKAAARGEYAPRVDLAHPEAYLARHPETGARQVQHDKPVFTAAFMTAMKVEQNVLSTPLVHEIGKRAVAIMRSEAFAAEVVGVASWEELRTVLDKKVAAKVVKELLAECDAAPESALGLCYANLKRVADFNFTFFPTSLQNTTSAKLLLRGGINTALNAMTSLGVTASALVALQPQHSVVGVMRNSLPLVLRLASSHMNVFQAHNLVLNMSNAEGVEQRLELVTRGDKTRVEPSAASLELLASKYGLRPDTILHGTTGCPAGHSLGDGNPLQQLAEAFADLVERTALVRAHG